LNPQRRWSHVAWLLVMCVMFLRYRRHLWLFALVSLAVLAINARYIDTQAMWTWWRKTTRQPRVALPQPFRVIGRSGACVVPAVVDRSGYAVQCFAIARDNENVARRRRRVLSKRRNCEAASSTTTRIRVTCSGT
jgi:hypothetical protein